MFIIKRRFKTIAINNKPLIGDFAILCQFKIMKIRNLALEILNLLLDKYIEPYKFMLRNN